MTQPLTRGGTPWEPRYLDSIDPESCIGCGRCFKVCGRDVMTLVGINDDDEVVSLEDEDEEVERKVMMVVHPENCIGCDACSRVCGKNCQTHVAA
ncbi:ferredoxin III, nif-specific [Telmatospirillum sp. J64-1]|uniref:ferredoxin III, nif-specific n=1 Tax=Telmatospirillum sp. J64-1 TaxID=2502183 RepID=UPI00115C9A27|nr:ferredoxin III, nif-specific [Telmatospirillum sp. J64-1]